MGSLTGPQTGPQLAAIKTPVAGSLLRSDDPYLAQKEPGRDSRAKSRPPGTSPGEGKSGGAWLA